MRILEQLKGFVVWFWFTLFPSVRVRRWVNEVMLSAYHMSLQGQCCELVVLQLVWSAFSDVIQKNKNCLTAWIHWMARFSHQSHLFLPWWYRRVPRWQWESSLGNITCQFHHSPEFHPTGNLWDVLAKTLLIKSRSWQKMNATLDRNKCNFD